MRYVIVSVVKGKAGNFNNNLRKEVFQKFNAKSSKLPAHFTIKAPFEYDDIEELEEVLQNFCKNHKRAPYKIKNYNHFDNRAIYMEVIMSKEGKKLHDDLFDELYKISDNGDCICGETRTSGSRGGTVCGRCEMDFKVPERQQSV